MSEYDETELWWAVQDSTLLLMLLHKPNKIRRVTPLSPGLRYTLRPWCYSRDFSSFQEDPGFLKTTGRRFESADQDYDSRLSKEEFAIFLFPELAPEMTQNLYNEEMADRDT